MLRKSKLPIWALGLVLLVLPSKVIAQHTLSGKVLDSKTKEPLVFANIVANEEREGTSTDTDGRFVLHLSQPIVSLSVSYVGYEDLVVNVSSAEQGVEILMVEKSIRLGEIVIRPGENPAHRIIDLTFANRKENHGERRSSFSYKSYSKFYLTLDKDSLPAVEPESTLEKEDSSEFNIEKFVENHHLFMMESVTERHYYPPNKDNEKVLATRVSGVKDPSFLALAAQSKSFSFYEPKLEIQDKTYLSPISGGSTNQYLFTLEDTLWNDADTVFVISFKPRLNKKFDGLKGLLYINSDGYAIQNVIAEPTIKEAGFGLKVQQMHEKVGGRQWFPIQLNNFLYLDGEDLGSSGLVGVGRTYIQEVEFEPEIDRRDLRGIELEVMEGAHTREESFWNQYRVDSLDLRESNTYQFIDSIGEVYKFDRRLKTLEALMSGVLPYKFLDFNIDRLLSFNDYEGVRTGLGTHTNQRFSKVFRVGGYGAYGFRDSEWKYGFDGSVIIDWRRQLELNVSYQNDVLESGGVAFKEERQLLSPAMYRSLYVNRMDSYEKLETTLSFRALKHFKFELFVNEQDRISNDDYQFISPTTVESPSNPEIFRFTEAGLNLRFAYNERLASTRNRLVSFGTNSPILHLNITKGFDDIGSGEFDYWKYNLKLEKTHKMPRLGESSVQLIMGAVEGDLPYTQLYNMRASYSQLGIIAPGSFETMRVNEFLADRYAALFLRHNFKDLIVQWGKFKPQFQLVTNIGVGSLRRPEAHTGIDISTMERGYFESGVQLDKLVKMGAVGVGLGALYRYGPYALDSFEENAALKVTAEFTF